MNIWFIQPGAGSEWFFRSQGVWSPRDYYHSRHAPKHLRDYIIVPRYVGSPWLPLP